MTDQQRIEAGGSELFSECFLPTAVIHFAEFNRRKFHTRQQPQSLPPKNKTAGSGTVSSREPAVLGLRRAAISDGYV